MEFDYYYDLLKNVSTEELLKRKDNEDFVEEYRYVCKKIIEARESGKEQEPNLSEEEYNKGRGSLYEEYKDREVPESLEECCRMDNTSKSLFSLSKSVEKGGTIILILILLVGIVVSITDSIVIGYEENSVLNAVDFITTLSTWVIYAIIEYWICKTIALILTGLASIVYNSRITSNVSLYSAKKGE
ncbi:MAG: hypothetical protein IKB60_03505 [Clostridia bacterium]|nr:hypothetical protein [Clostridia bacterium]